MRNRPNATGRLWLILLGIPPVGWLALHLAPCLGDGLAGILCGVQQFMETPFSIVLVQDSLKCVFACLAIYGLCVGIAISSRRNTRNGEEHGSAKWGNSKTILRKYRDKDYMQNLILTQNVRIGLDGRKHRRNLNVLVCGGSGAGKTRFYCKPNLLQATHLLLSWIPREN